VPENTNQPVRPELFTTVIARGGSATRAIADSLKRSGINMGKTNVFGDKPPYQIIYDLARLMCTDYMRVRGEEFDFTAALENPVPDVARHGIETYLSDIALVSGPRGWKLPETVLIFPWLVRLYPDLWYIYWTRGVWDLRNHKSDMLLVEWGVLPETRDLMRLAALSWKLQYDIVAQTPRPARWLHVRMEDYVLDHNRTRARLEQFLGMSLDMTPPRPETVKKSTPLDYEFTLAPMRELGYDV